MPSTKTPGTSSSVSAVERGALRSRSAALARVTLDEELNRVRRSEVLPVTMISLCAPASACAVSSGTPHRPFRLAPYRHPAARRKRPSGLRRSPRTDHRRASVERYQTQAAGRDQPLQAFLDAQLPPDRRDGLPTRHVAGGENLDTGLLGETDESVVAGWRGTSKLRTVDCAATAGDAIPRQWPPSTRTEWSESGCA